MNNRIAISHQNTASKNMVTALWLLLLCVIVPLKGLQTKTHMIQSPTAQVRPTAAAPDNFFDDLADLEPDWQSGQSLSTKSPFLPTEYDLTSSSPIIETVNVTQFDMAYIATPSLSRQSSANNTQPSAEQVMQSQHIVPETTVEQPTPSPLPQKKTKKKRRLTRKQTRTRSSYSSAIVSSATLQATQKKKKNTNTPRKRTNIRISQSSTDHEQASTLTTKRQRHAPLSEKTEFWQPTISSTATIAPLTPKTQHSPQQLESPRTAPAIFSVRNTLIPITPPTTFLAPPLIPLSYVPMQDQSMFQASSAEPSQSTATVLTPLPNGEQTASSDTTLNSSTQIPEEHKPEDTSMQAQSPQQTIPLATLIALAAQPLENDTVPEKQPTTTVETNRPYCCTLCCKQFTNETTLYQHLHVQNMHTFCCQTCQETFAEKNELDKHLASPTHSDRKFEQIIAVAQVIRQIREQNSTHPTANPFNNISTSTSVAS